MLKTDPDKKASALLGSESNKTEAQAIVYI